MEKFLDTAFPAPIRFRQKVLMVNSNLRWNYSPLKRKGHPVAGWPFRLSQQQENKILSFHLRSTVPASFVPLACSSVLRCAFEIGAFSQIFHATFDPGITHKSIPRFVDQWSQWKSVVSLGVQR